MCQISKFEYKCASQNCKTPERIDAEIQVLRYCDWYTNRQLHSDFDAAVSGDHDHGRQYTATKVVRNKNCRLCQPASILKEQLIWISLLLLTTISIAWCGSSSSDVFNCAWCLAMLHVLLITFPVAFRRPQNTEKIQDSIEIFPTPGETCAEYCSKLCTPARTTHVAVELAAKVIGETQVGKQRLTLVAASIYMASQLVSEPQDAQRVMDATGVGHVDFWNAYWRLLLGADVLVTGELICHGADMSKLPEIGRAV